MRFHVSSVFVLLICAFGANAQVAVEFEVTLAPELLLKGSNIQVLIEQDGSVYNLVTDNAGKTDAVPVDRDLVGHPITIDIGEGPTQIGSLMGQRFVFSPDHITNEDLVSLIYASPVARSISFAPSSGNPNSGGGNPGGVTSPPYNGIQSDGIDDRVLVELTESDDTFVGGLGFLSELEAIDRYRAFHGASTSVTAEAAVMLRTGKDVAIADQGQMFIYVSTEAVSFVNDPFPMTEYFGSHVGGNGISASYYGSEIDTSGAGHYIFELTGELRAGDNVLILQESQQFISRQESPGPFSQGPRFRLIARPALRSRGPIYRSGAFEDCPPCKPGSSGCHVQISNATCDPPVPADTNCGGPKPVSNEFKNKVYEIGSPKCRPPGTGENPQTYSASFGGFLGIKLFATGPIQVDVGGRLSGTITYTNNPPEGKCQQVWVVVKTKITTWERVWRIVGLWTDVKKPFFKTTQCSDTLTEETVCVMPKV